MTATTIPTHVRFGNLIKAESRKYVNTRAALVLSILMAAVLAAVTIGAIAAYPDLTKVATGTNLQFLPLAMTSALTAIIVILPVTSEWTQRGVLTTFVVEPRRERVIAAKALVALGVVLTVWLAIQLSWAVFNAVGAAAHGGRCSTPLVLRRTALRPPGSSTGRAGSGASRSSSSTLPWLSPSHCCCATPP